MKTKSCKYCKEEINKKAKRCPYCGGKLVMPALLKVLIIVGIIIAGIVSCANSFKEAVEEVEKSYKDKNGKTEFKLNETFENSYEKITMTEVNTDFKDYSEYFKPSEGNKIIMAKFEVENISEDRDDILVSSAEFSAYVDGVAAERYYFADDKYDDFNFTVSKGKKTVGYVLYEVPKTTKKITIDYDANFWVDDTKIEFIIQ